jgi:tetrahydromethanopterin S-methyltransferase subunit E
MGDFCMKLIAQIVSFFGWVIGTLVSILAKLSPILDDSISIVAGLIGVIAGLIWVSILITKRKAGKIDLEIKEIELKKLKDEFES